MPVPCLLASTERLYAGTASAQGLFSGLSNRKEEIEKASSEFAKVVLSCDQSVLLKGEMARKDDGTPDVTFGKNGDLQMAVLYSVDPERYAAFSQSATNAFAKYADRILTPDEENPKDNSGKPKIRVDDTIFELPKDMESAIKVAKGMDDWLHSTQPCMTAFLVDIDGNVIAEGGWEHRYNPYNDPPSERALFPLEHEIALYTCSASALNCDKNNPHSIGDLAVHLFSGGTFAHVDDGWYYDGIDWDAVGVPRPSGGWEVNRQHLDTVVSATGTKKQGMPWVGKFDDHRDVEREDSRYCRYYDFDFRTRKPVRGTISFGRLSKEKLEAVQGVRICIGGIQYRASLTEIKERAEKEAAERKALEED